MEAAGPSGLQRHQPTYLPPELVELILRLLDGRTFARCRRVCRAWKHIADRLALETDIWKKFCETEYADAWASIYERGDLQWSDIYINICLWAKVNKAWAIKQLLKTYNGVDKHINTLNVSKGGSLNVTMQNSVKVYDIATLKSTEEFTGQFFCYFENEFMKMIHSETHTLFLKPAFNFDPSTSQDSMSIDNVYLFRVVGEICYYITLQQELWMFNLKHNNYKKRSFLVKWYNFDSIIGIDCHQNKIFLLTKTGYIMTYDSNKLVRLRKVNWPTYNASVYKRFYLYRGNIFFYCDFSNFHISISNGKEVTYDDWYVSCILLHGNILVLGTYFGMISLYLIKNIEDLLRLNRMTPITTHLLCVDFPVSGIDVFEGPRCHTIFAWTRSNIFMIKYSHLSTNHTEKMLCSNFAVCSIIQCADKDLNSNSDNAT